MKNRLLIVEDDEKNLAVAKNAFQEIEIVSAKDYNTAIEMIEEHQDHLYGALIDCFFPKKQGNENTDLGREVIEEICQYTDKLETKPYRQRLDEAKSFLSVLGFQRRHPDLEDKLVNGFSTGEQISDPMVSALKRSVKFLPDNKAKDVVLQGLDMYFPGSTCKISYRQALMDSMIEDSNNQPLGVELAKDLSDYSVPFVMLTSEKHHGFLCEPVERYFNDKRWEIVTGAEKENEETWKKGYKKLNEVN